MTRLQRNVKPRAWSTISKFKATFVMQTFETVDSPCAADIKPSLNLQNVRPVSIHARLE